MSDKSLIIGVDIGTSGCKTVLIDAGGKVIDKAFREYPLYIERHGWSEQDPADWWNAAASTLKEVMSRDPSYVSRLKAVGLTGQMHGLVALDADGKVLRRSILWNDQRTDEQCRDVHENLGGMKNLLKITNNPMLPGYTAGKLLWMKKYEPEIYSRIHKFLNPKDYIRYMLTGIYATEVSDASGTGVFNVRDRVWAEDLFRKLEIPIEWAPDVYESTVISGHVTSEAAELTGLPAELPVAGGGGDSVIQTLGAGVINSSNLMTTIGTAGIISTALEQYIQSEEGRVQIFCNVMPGTWHMMGVTLSAGSSLKWYRDNFGEIEKLEAAESGRDEYEILSEAAETAPPGSRGLLFLPYLGGERCPYADPKLKAALVGLSYNTGKAEVVRSIMEGVILSFWDVNSIFRDLGMDFEAISVSGGGAQSGFWRQIHADVFQKKVMTYDASREGAAYGAAMVAAVGCGLWDSFEQGVEMMKVENVVEPEPDRKEIYMRLYRIYNDLYEQLKPGFYALAEEG